MRWLAKVWRRVWSFLRLALRQLTWALVSVLGFLILGVGAPRWIGRVLELEPGWSWLELLSGLTILFGVFSILIAVVIWPKLDARFRPLDTRPSGLMKGLGAVVAVTFLGPSFIFAFTVPTYGMRAFAVLAGCALLVWACLLLPRLGVPGLRPGAIARDVSDLRVRPLQTAPAVLAFLILLFLQAVTFPNFVNFSRTTPPTTQGDSESP
jgi:hypothetical protein